MSMSGGARPMMLLPVMDSSAKSSGCCKPVCNIWPQAQSGDSNGTLERKLLEGGLHSVPAASSREFRGLLADLRNRQEMFFKQVLDHQETLRGQLLALHFSSQASIDAQNLLKQRQEDLIAEFREFSGKKRITKDRPETAMKIAQITSTADKLVISPRGGSASPKSSNFGGNTTIDNGVLDHTGGRRAKSCIVDDWIGDVGGNVDTVSTVDTKAAARSSNKVPQLFGEMGMDKSQLDQEEYNVAQFYYERGCAQWIARSEGFSNVTLLVIFLNAVYIGYDADNNLQDNLLDADLQFQICENAFCVFFFLEWTIRFLAFRSKCDGRKDMWFRFDTALVTMMVVETWVLPMCLSGGTGIPSGLVKLVRLLRLARMARIMRAFPDLVAMIKGVKAASRAVGSALLMLLGLIYVFAIIMFTLLKDEQSLQINVRFRRLGLSMWTLLVDGTFLDGFGTISRALMDQNHYAPVVVLLIFVLCSALTVMNMLIGVLCEVVSSVATAEKEDGAIRLVKEKLLSLLRTLDEDGSGRISKEEIGAVLRHDSALDVLANLHVEVSHLLDHLDMFFEEEGELSIQQIMDLILMLREDRPLQIKDMLLETSFSRWKTSKSFANVEKCIMELAS